MSEQLSLFAPATRDREPPEPPAEDSRVEPPAQAPAWPIDAEHSPLPEERTLFRTLHEALEGRLRSLVLTDNRRTILSVKTASRRDREGLHARLHRAFAGAPEGVLTAVAALIDGRCDDTLRDLSRKTLRVWMDRFWKENGAPEPRHRITLYPIGETLDLRTVCDELNTRFFEGRLEVEVTWSNVFPGTVCRRRSIRLGSYQADLDVVRIHPALDRPNVPRYVVESIVYHELLHADIPPVFRNGRRHVHTPEFRRRERQFPEYRRAKAWIRKNLGRLLRY